MHYLWQKQELWRAPLCLQASSASQATPAALSSSPRLPSQRAGIAPDFLSLSVWIRYNESNNSHSHFWMLLISSALLNYLSANEIQTAKKASWDLPSPPLGCVQGKYGRLRVDPSPPSQWTTEADHPSSKLERFWKQNGKNNNCKKIKDKPEECQVTQSMWPLESQNVLICILHGSENHWGKLPAL